MPKDKEFRGYRNPFGRKESPEIIVINNKDDKPFGGYRSPGLGTPEYVEEGDDLAPIEKPKINPNDKFRGYRSPVMAQPEEEEPQYAEPPSDDDSDFIKWFGENIYKGTKEEAKKKALPPSTVEKTPDELEIEKVMANLRKKGSKLGISSKEIMDKKKEQYGDDFGSWSEAWEGAKASITDLPEATKQIWHAVRGNKKELQESMDAVQENAKKYNSTAGKLGYFTGSMAPTIASMLLPTGVGQVAGAGRMAQLVKMLSGPVAKGVIGGIASGALTPVEGGSVEDFASKKILQTGMGGAIGIGGGLLTKGLSKLASPSAMKVGKMGVEEIADFAEKTGMNLTPGQLGGNKAIKMAEEALSRTPGGAGVMAKGAEKNQKAINKMAVKMINPNAADDILEPTMEFIKNETQQAGKAYDKLRSRGQIDLGSSYLKSSKKLLNDLEGKLGKKTTSEADNLIKDIYTDVIKKKGKITGKEFQGAVSDLRDKALNLGPRTADARKLYSASNKLENYAERALEKSGDLTSLNNLKTARTKIAKIKRIEDAIDDPATGNINISKIFSTAKKKGIAKSGLEEDIDIAASIMRNLGPSFKGNSPTAQLLANMTASSGIGGAVMSGNMPLAAGILGGMGSANLGAKALSSKLVKDLAVKGMPRLKRNIPMIQKGILGTAISGPRSANK